jgi:hypothetical protein
MPAVNDVKRIEIHTAEPAVTSDDAFELMAVTENVEREK